MNACYEKQDPEQTDACIDEVMLPDKILLPGIDPGGIFHGRGCAGVLLPFTLSWPVS